jgi:hypothetical protein
MELNERRKIIKGIRTQNNNSIQSYFQVIWKIIESPIQENIDLYFFENPRRVTNLNIKQFNDYFKYEFFKFILMDNICHTIFENGNFSEEVSPFFKGLAIKISISIIECSESKTIPHLIYELMNERYSDDGIFDLNDNYRLKNFYSRIMRRTSFIDFIESKIYLLEDKLMKKVLELWLEGYRIKEIADNLNISSELAFMYKSKGLSILRTPFLIHISREI